MKIDILIAKEYWYLSTQLLLLPTHARGSYTHSRLSTYSVQPNYGFDCISKRIMGTENIV